MRIFRKRLTEEPEAGNTILLSVILSAVAIALVLTFGSITQMHIERKRLLALADAAALHAASALDEDHYYTTPGADLHLTDASVHAAVEDFLVRTPAAQHNRLHALQIDSPTAAIDGDTAQVTLSAFIRPTYIPWSVTPFEGFRIQVSTTARAD